MYDIFYNFLSNENMFASAMTYESTQIICRYLSLGLTIATFFILVGIAFSFAKLIYKAFKG